MAQIDVGTHMSAGGSRIPAVILTGFLGSGKTTVLNRLVRHSDMARALVVINELGDIGLDHELVETVSGDVVLLRSGCLCCSVRSDLVVTMQDILTKARAGTIPMFDRVVIETTGLADPQPVMQAFIADPDVALRFELRSIITTIDAVLGEATLSRYVEAVKQAAVADLILVTKTDMAPLSEELKQRIRELNRTAAIEELTIETPVDPARLWEMKNHWPHAPPADCAVDGDLMSEPYGGSIEHSHESSGGAAHTDGVRTFSITRSNPLDADVLDRWLVSFLDARGPALLRFKAIVNVRGLEGPLVLHGVQHVIHPPVQLKAWPSSDRRTRMVFITMGIDGAEMDALLAPLLRSPSAARPLDSAP